MTVAVAMDLIVYLCCAYPSLGLYRHIDTDYIRM